MMIERILRAIRGGSWASLPPLLCASVRNWGRPDGRGNFDGFRLVIVEKD